MGVSVRIIGNDITHIRWFYHLIPGGAYDEKSRAWLSSKGLDNRVRNPDLSSSGRGPDTRDELLFGKDGPVFAAKERAESQAPNCSVRHCCIVPGTYVVRIYGYVRIDWASPWLPRKAAYVNSQNTNNSYGKIKRTN